MRAGRSPGAKRASASVDGGHKIGVIHIYLPAMRPRIPERAARRYSNERGARAIGVTVMQVHSMLLPITATRSGSASIAARFDQEKHLGAASFHGSHT